ncbi:hypothetical protein PoB_003783700 [Plakobranchus ocellatus]|uniref:SAM domain-containing protein n=1 Tax=Plakobranchus ocellatus TaxID=259542 RepID=A0AAV4AVK3_9GAST|nr:hypothetical protein PoB_003783700 [Plakobranchus ocellatus]
MLHLFLLSLQLQFGQSPKEDFAFDSDRPKPVQPAMSTSDLATFKQESFRYHTDDMGDGIAHSSQNGDLHPSEATVYTNGVHDIESDSNNSSSSNNNNNNNNNKNNGNTSEETADTNSGGLPGQDSPGVQLKGGNKLLEESRTDVAKSPVGAGEDSGKHLSVPPTHSRPAQNPGSAGSVVSTSNGTGTAKARAAKSPYTSPSLENIPVEEIRIPESANISSFTCDQLANFLRCFNVEGRVISHLHRKQVDGKRFSRLKDSELESLGMKNPVITYFRDKSHVKTAKRTNFFLL